MMYRLFLTLCLTATPAFAANTKRTPAPPAAEAAEPKWTIVCAIFTGPNHAAQARSAKDYVSKLSGMQKFYLVQGADKTELNYGHYPDVNDQAVADRKAIAALTNPANHDKLFRAVLLQPIDGDEPVAPKEWDLRNARGYWSLQVASFRDDPKRKQAAVDLCAKYRKDGYDAYYFHGPLISSVCIGAFPVNSVKFDEVETRKDPLTGREVTRLKDPNEVEAEDPDEVVMVVPADVPLPEGQMMTPDGKRVKAVQHKREIVDPRFLAVKKAFPHHADNDQVGKVVTVKGQRREVYTPSFLVVVPGQKEARQAQAAAGNVANPGASQQPPSQPPVIGPNGPVLLPGSPSTGALPDRPAAAVSRTDEPPAQPAPTAPQPTQPKVVKAPTKKPAQGGKLKSIDD